MALAVGIILIFMSVVHIVYGEKQQVAVLKAATSDSMLIGSVRVMSVQGGVLLCAIGVIYILKFAGVVALNGPAAYFPLGLVILNILSLLVVAVAKHREIFAKTVPQLIIFTVIVILQVLVITKG